MDGFSHGAEGAAAICGEFVGANDPDDLLSAISAMARSILVLERHDLTLAAALLDNALVAARNGLDNKW